MRQLVSAALVVAVLTTTASPGAAGPIAAAPGGQPPPAVSTAIEQSFRAAYSLDHDEAMAHARRAVALGPNESQAHRTLAAILWLHILFRRGAVSIDHYLGSLARQRASSAKPDPAFVAEFKSVLARAIELAEARLKQNPRDLQARFDVGSVYALQASYTASVEGSMTAAFRSARRAYDAQEEVLAKDPSRVGAGLVVGLYRYLISALALPTRLFAYVVGFGGGKEKGIEMLEAAIRDPHTRIDAKTALMLVYSREGRHGDVVTLARELRTEFPRNRLFLLEEGAAAIRAGRAADAEATLTQGINGLDQDARPKVPGERAYWLYKRGLARVILRKLDGARSDLQTAQQSLPAGWVNGRIHLELGKIADLTGRRADAVAAYGTAKTTCDANHDTVCSAEASRLQRRAYGK
jgi:tetratricopeptide (TPR) repeat protein